jgi:multidrug efflux system membrane fusion protein
MLDAERNHTAPMARRKKLFAIAAALAVVAVAVGLAAQYNKESRAAVRKAPVAVPVTVAPVVAKTVPVRLYAIGNVEPFTTVAVKARVDGQILSVHFNEGDEVRQGQLLFEIDPRPFAAALQQVQANLLRDRALGDRAARHEKRYKGHNQKKLITPHS